LPFFFLYLDMKPKQTALKVLLIVTILFFIVVHTAYYWEGKLGELAFPAGLILVLLFVVLSIITAYQVYFVIKDRLRNKLRNYTFAALLLALSLTIYKPFGLINFESLEGEDKLVAYKEGVASCGITLKLRDTGKFYMKEVCFGVDEVRGDYKIKGDSILFSEINSRDRILGYGIIQDNSLELYKSLRDSVPLQLKVVKNTLKKDIAAK